MTAEQILEKAKSILKKEPEVKETKKVELGEVTLEDGSVIYFDDQLVEGARVWTMVNEENVPLPAGEYVLADGSTLVITEAGVVATITPAAARVEEPVAEEMEASPDAAVETETATEEVNTNLSAEDIKAIVMEAIKPLQEKIDTLTAEKQKAEEKVEELETQLSQEPASDGVKASPEGKSDTKLIKLGSNNAFSNKSALERVNDMLYG